MVSNLPQILALKTALIVIDVQNDFCDDEGIFSRVKRINMALIQKAVSNLLFFTDRCRELDLPVIFVRTTHSEWTDSASWLGRVGGKIGRMGICAPNSWGSEFYKIKPHETDCIVTKHRYSAFFGTDLDLILRSRAVETLLVTGVATNVCVETTARDAYNRNYNVVLVEDCCGAFDAGEHKATLINMRNYFGAVAASAEIINIVQQAQPGRAEVEGE
jgi:ureidoacrylate peracid hydrolase